MLDRCRYGTHVIARVYSGVDQVKSLRILFKTADKAEKVGGWLGGALRGFGAMQKALDADAWQGSKVDTAWLVEGLKSKEAFRRALLHMLLSRLRCSMSCAVHRRLELDWAINSGNNAVAAAP
jgi:hypothetical protein